MSLTKTVGWVYSYEYADTYVPSSPSLAPPEDAQAAGHKQSPSERQRDAQREGKPVTSSEPERQHASRWKTFVTASALPLGASEKRQVVDEDWLSQHPAHLDQPWLAELGDGDRGEDADVVKRRRKGKMQKFQVPQL
jgi:hypothetical protein